MKIHNVEQGSQEWLELRASHNTASEAPAMLGESKYTTRDELLAQKASQVQPEIDADTQRIFDNGHKYEAAARLFAEEIIGEDLYPATGTEAIDDIPMLASFDGITMLEDVIWEHKSLNDNLRECLPKGEIPLMYRIQMQQQLMVSGAEKCLFMASDGTRENMLYCWYEGDDELASRIIDGWHQFNRDLKEFTPTESSIQVTGKPIEELPALLVNVSGQVATTNIDDFKAMADEFIANINRNPETDQDFADAEKVVKFCDKAEKQIAMVKQQSVEQMADVSKVFRAMDEIAENLRDARLSLDKLVKQKKTEMKQAIVIDGQNKLKEYLQTTNKEFDAEYIQDDISNFAAVVKGKRTLDSVRSAVNDEVARVKIELTNRAHVVRDNLALVTDNECKHLFPDLPYLIQKPQDDFENLVKTRIQQHLDAENEKRRQAQEAKAQAEKTQEVMSEVGKRVLEENQFVSHAEPDNEDISDETKIGIYLDRIEYAISQVPEALDDKKLANAVKRIQAKLNKAAAELRAKIEPDSAAA